MPLVKSAQSNGMMPNRHDKLAASATTGSPDNASGLLDRRLKRFGLNGVFYVAEGGGLWVHGMIEGDSVLDRQRPDLGEGLRL